MYGLTPAKVMKHRENIVKMWDNIPPDWVDLNIVLRDNTGEEGYDKLCNKLRRNGKLVNNCGAVGCVWGWSSLDTHFQKWCKRHDLNPEYDTSLSTYLGLFPSDADEIFSGREEYDISEYEEAKYRLRNMMDCEICIEGDEEYDSIW